MAMTAGFREIRGVPEGVRRGRRVRAGTTRCEMTRADKGRVGGQRLRAGADEDLQIWGDDMGND